MTDLTKYIRTPTPATADLRTFLNAELAKIQAATDTFFKMLGDVNVLLGSIEGDFIPTVAGATTAGVGTYTAQNGRFIKIGRLVVFYLRVDWSAHTGTGGITILGLPYAAGASIRAAILINPLSAAIAANTICWTAPGTARLELETANNAGAVAMVGAASLSLTGAYFADT